MCHSNPSKLISCGIPVKTLNWAAKNKKRANFSVIRFNQIETCGNNSVIVSKNAGSYPYHHPAGDVAAVVLIDRHK